MTVTDLGQELVQLFFDPTKRADPYPLYHRLRAEDPVHRSVIGVWILTRHADVQALIRDPRLSSDEGHSTISTDSNPDRPFSRMVDKIMLFRDPPDHTRLRNLVNKAFTPRVVEQMRPHIQEIVDRLLDDVAERGSMDLVEEFAYPLPVIVICEMLGIPPSDLETFSNWVRDLANRFDINPLRTADIEERGDRATEAFREYFEDLIDQRRKRPGDDLLWALIAAEEDGDRLDTDELITMTALLLLAGHETTANLIGNGMLALFRNPDQMAMLRDDPTVVKNAVEELLRYDSPVQMTQRIPLEDIDLGNVTLPRGENTALVMGAANRDPARFPDPDRLDLRRADVQHVSFGGGIHYCLGAALARAEAQIAFPALLRRLPDLHLATDHVEFRPTFVLRGLHSLPVAWSAP